MAWPSDSQAALPRVRGEHPGGVAEGVRLGQLVVQRYPHIVQRDIGLPDGALAELAGDQFGGVAVGIAAVGVLLDDDGLHLAVVGVAGPDDDDVGDAGVADPALGSVEHPGVAVAVHGGLQRHGVGAVVGLGEREGADLVQRGHRRQPALLLFLAAQQVDRAHGQSGLHAHEGGDAAVAAGQLQGHHAQFERGQPGQP